MTCTFYLSQSWRQLKAPSSFERAPVQSQAKEKGQRQIQLFYIGMKCSF